MLGRSTSRWVLAVAVIFCAYAAVLLLIAFHSQAQLRLAADAHLIARSMRQASAVSDLAAERRDDAAELAESHEVKTYLINRALGMSLRYGLHANLDAIEKRFREQAAQKTTRGEPTYTRVILFDENGEVLVDLVPGDPPIAFSQKTRDGPNLTIDPENRRIIATAPVFHKESFSGSVATVGDLGQLSRYLLSEYERTNYQEILLMADGFELPAPGRQRVAHGGLAAALAKLPENTLVALDSVLDAPKLIGQMHAALSQSDAPAFTRAAHTLKSSSANVGARRLADLCKTLEACGRQGNIEPAAAMLAELQAEYARTADALTSEVKVAAG